MRRKFYAFSQNFHGNKFIADFERKADILNHFFATQCTLVDKTSKLPSVFESQTLQLLLTIDFTRDDIEKTIKNLDPNKSQNYDMISNHMVEKYSSSNCKPLDLSSDPAS